MQPLEKGSVVGMCALKEESKQEKEEGWTQ